MASQATTPPSFIFTDQTFQNPSFCGGFGMAFKKSNEKGLNQARVSTEKEAVDKLLAAKMNGLSVKDRETVLEEVNGIPHYDPEEPSRLQACLEELDTHINKMKGGTIYEMAERMNPKYVSNRAFRLMFLRARRYTTSEGQNRYHPKQAAELLLNFFNTKHTLFGGDKLVKDITLNDLEPEDREGLKGGSCQVLPNRDMSGRSVVVAFRGAARFPSVESETRAKYYCFMSVLEREEAQKNGVVVIFYTIGQYQDSKGGGNVASQGKHILNFPIHFAAIQVCVDDYKQYILLRAFFQMVPAQFAAKVRVHLGTHLECQYTLRGYGIPEGSIPISQSDHSVLLHNHMLWYHQREALDSSRGTADTKPLLGMSNESGSDTKDDLSLGIPLDEMDDDVFSLDPFDESDISPTPSNNNIQNSNGAAATPPSVVASRAVSPTAAISPRSTDVLFGQSHKSHPGNLQFHEIITQHVSDYEAATGRQKKIEFAEHLVQHIKASGSRFLMYDKGLTQWVEVPDTKARNKVSKTIRNRRRSAGE